MRRTSDFSDFFGPDRTGCPVRYIIIRTYVCMRIIFIYTHFTFDFHRLQGQVVRALDSRSRYRWFEPHVGRFFAYLRSLGSDFFAYLRSLGSDFFAYLRSLGLGFVLKSRFRVSFRVRISFKFFRKKKFRKKVGQKKILRKKFEGVDFFCQKHL